MSDVNTTALQHSLNQCTEEERRALLQLLRTEFPHPFETQLRTTAEKILDAIARSSDLTIRGVRGILAEAEFQNLKLPTLEAAGFQPMAIEGDKPYDFLVSDKVGEVRIQVKLQRQEGHVPLLACEARKLLLGHCGDAWTAETQRTRNGKSRKKKGTEAVATVESTRPYRFGEFDILAVCLQPATGSWSDFMYTVERWLIPSSTSQKHLLSLQPVSRTPNDDYTDDLLTCIEWFRSGVNKVVYGARPTKSTKPKRTRAG